MKREYDAHVIFPKYLYLYILLSIACKKYKICNLQSSDSNLLLTIFLLLNLTLNVFTPCVLPIHLSQNEGMMLMVCATDMLLKFLQAPLKVFADFMLNRKRYTIDATACWM